MVGGVPLPLTPEQMAAAGVSPEQAPGGIPMPSMQNPYGGIPSDAVAGIGGGPVIQQSGADIGTPMTPMGAQGPGAAFAPGVADPYAKFRVHLDNGAPPAAPAGLAGMAAQQQAAIDMRKGMTPAEAAATAAAGALPPEAARLAEKVEPAGVGGAGAQPLKLIPTVGEAQAAAGKPGQASSDELAQQRRIFDKTLAGGAAGGTAPKLGVTGETVKHTEYGAVPQGLSDDIADQQADIDRQQAASLDQNAVAATTSLQQQAEVIKQQQADAAAAQAERARVDQRIASLQSKSDADEAALTQAKPKEVKDYWGGSMMAEIISGISLAIGAGVQARTGHNPGAEMLDKSIDRWVNDQRQQYEAAKDKATLSGNRYKDALQTFGTPEAAQAQLHLQATAAKNALMQNMAEQSKVPQMLANAQLMIQQDQLKRQQLRAQSIQQAGMREVEEKMALRGGTGSAADRELSALRKQAEAKKLQDEIGGRTNEDKRTELEANKAQGSGQKLANAATEAADAAERFRSKASSLSGRAPGEGKGELEAARIDAETKYAAYLAASGGASTRNALGVAQEFFKGKGDAIRGPSADPALNAHIKTLRGNAVRAHAAHAAGIAPETQTPDDEIGATE